MEPILKIKGLSKTYAGGLEALRNVDLEINRGEIFALLGPNGAGKTTLINIVTGIVRLPAGTVSVDDHDIVRDFRATRSCIGYVPQELPIETFESVWDTCNFSRGLFGKKPNARHVENVLRDLSLWDKKDERIMTLSGGMKRRVLIAKALAHEPTILFLDEPTAGVDVELRQDMWKVVSDLSQDGVTVVFTTQYIEEAERLADRVGVINHGEIILVQEKHRLMSEMGRKQLTLHLQSSLAEVPPQLAQFGLELANEGHDLVYTYDTKGDHTGITSLLAHLHETGIRFNDLETTQSSLEEIFVGLVHQ